LVTLALVEARYPHLARAAREGRGRVLYSLGITAAQRGEIAAARRYWRAAIGQGWSVKAAGRFAASLLGHLPPQPAAPAPRPDHVG
jgi:hypothetical protein